MSEYQYYEFRALDRRLTEREIDKLEELSSRAEITSTGLVNEYSYGDFRGDPVKLMDKFFDAFVYVANWGTRRLMFRLPRDLVDVATFKAYCQSESLSLTVRKSHVLIEFHSDGEEFEGGWEEGAGWMDALVKVREELLNADHRSLLIGWLLNAQLGHVDEHQMIPPIPAGLGKRSSAQKALIDFLRLDERFVKKAANWSGKLARPTSATKDYTSWLASIPESEKNRYLLRLLEGDDTHLRSELLKRFQTMTVNPQIVTAAASNRTVGQLMGTASSD